MNDEALADTARFEVCGMAFTYAELVEFCGVKTADGEHHFVCFLDAHGLLDGGNVPPSLLIRGIYE